MRNTILYRCIEAFAVEASGRLSADAAAGAELPFEIVEQRGGPTSLYCYRPLTSEFIASRAESLATLSAHGPALAALHDCEGLDVYLRERGRHRVPGEPGVQAEAVLVAFLAAMFDERSEFGFEPSHFEAAYAELERTLYEGHCLATVIAPVLGVALDPDTVELTLAEGLSLMRGDAVPDAPEEAVWGESDEPHVLAVLSVDQERTSRLPLAAARTRFRRILTALRLFERGGYAIGPVAWARTEAGLWRPVPIGASGRPRLLTLVPADQEDELRAFYDLVSRRRPAGGELAWALSRFEMGCERIVPFEALTDYLLALRALLEPEGPASGRLAQRLAVICAGPERRAALAGRTARAINLERSVISGLAGADAGVDALVDELAEHLRAILRDALCGHLEADLVGLADDLLAEAVDEIEPADAPQPSAAPEPYRAPSLG